MRMPKQNRMTPKGELVADPSRGTFMGNRGILHDAEGQIGHRTWRHRNWIICLTEFKGRKRPIMAPNRYTELFFLDEATALAAGHRPCPECRRRAYSEYRAALQKSGGLPTAAEAGELDALLHAERAWPGKFRQRTWIATVAELPNGAMIEADDRILLVAGDRLLEWSFQGYRNAIETRELDGRSVTVLTPKTNVSALMGGYQPGIHASAHALLAASSDRESIFSKVAGYSY